MKIGFILDSGEFGGAERQAFLLGRELKKKGHAVQFFYLRKGSSTYLDELLKSEGVDSYDLNFRFTSQHHTRFVHCIRLALRLRKYRLDILLPYTIRPNVNVNFGWQLTGAKRSFWNQRDIGFGFPKKYRDKVLWFALKNTSGFISNSEGGLEFLQSYLKLKQPSICIKNGVERIELISDNTNLRTQLKIDERNFIVLMLANLTRYKDHLTLLKAWKNISLSNGKLILAGSFGETYQSIIDYIKENNLESNVIVPGPLNSAQAIQLSDICILSSRIEGLPNSILEAMAMAKPVIATHVSGNIEALGDDYPFLFEPEDNKILGEQIQKLYSDEQLRKELGDSNQQRLFQEFSLEKLTDETLSFISLASE